MGIDLIAGGRNKKTARTAPKSDNVYLKLLVKVCLCIETRHSPCLPGGALLLLAAIQPSLTCS
jgi:hypothetical protein